MKAKTSIWKFVFLLVSIQCFTKVFCQRDSIVYYFDKDYNFCQKGKAFYVGIGVKEKGVIKLTSYTIRTGAPNFEGYFTDSTLSVKEGLFSSFDSLGYKISEGRYQNNSEEGLWLSWHHGNFSFDSLYYLNDSSYFENGNRINEISFNYHSNGRLSSRYFSDYLKNIENINTWNDSGLLKSKAHWVDKTGDEIWYYSNGSVRSVTHSEKGKVTSKKYYTEDGHEMTKQELKKREQDLEKVIENIKKKVEEASPQFPGGSASFRNYLGHHIKFPESFLKQIQPGETIKISFTLNKDGFAENVHVLEFKNYDLQQAVIDAFKHMPAWDMKGYKKFGPITYTLNISKF